AAVTGVLIVDFRHNALSSGEHELERMALVLADQAERTFQSLELVQTGLVRQMQARGIDTREEFVGQRNDPHLHDTLRKDAATLPHVDTLTMIDHVGRIIGHSHDGPISTEKHADRDYFKALRDKDAPTRFITEPILDKTTGLSTIYLAHRISGADDEFLGIILGAIKLQYFEAFYSTVAETSGDAIALVRADGSILARFPRLLPAEDPGTSPELRQNKDIPHIRAATHALESYPLEVRVSRSDTSMLGSWRAQALALGTGTAMVELGLVAIVLLVVRQLWSRARLSDVESERRVQDLRFGVALENLSQGLCMVDAARRILVINPRLVAMFNLPPERQFVGASLGELARVAIARGGLTPGDVRTLQAQIEALAGAGPANPIWELANGRSLALGLRPTPEGGWLVTVDDVTERRRDEARINHMARHDPLTDLPNRTLFAERLRAAIERARRGESCALLYLDLDHFKQVNDALGHSAGDALLREASGRLRSCVRTVDTVARLGGDEFAILQCASTQPADAETLAARLIAALSQPYDLDGHSVRVQASVGIAVLSGGQEDENTLLRKADYALYQAKSQGRGSYRLFDPSMEQAMQDRRQMEIGWGCETTPS
ncbi:MAG TPA: diguanylate cyclase, partial [Ancylobacter sp.]